MKKTVSFFNNYLYDSRRFYKYSSSKGIQTQQQLESKITARYHNLEKGLSLKEPRLGFGEKKIKLLLSLLEQYKASGYDTSGETYQTALSVLYSYISYHDKHNFDLTWLKDAAKEYEEPTQTLGGVKSLTKTDILSHVDKSFDELVESRHSIRNFSDKKVDKKLILKAIEIATNTPSVCNRQSGRIYVIHNSTIKEKVLDIQKGNRGFGHLVDSVLVVTSDLETFTNIGERNQSFIDGGMFGMTLVYALHSLGLATCILNWSAKKEKDIELRKALKIKDSENVIFLIAVGHYPVSFNVARSTRKKGEEITRVID